MFQSGPEQTGCRRQGQLPCRRARRQLLVQRTATMGRAVGDRGHSDTREASLEFQVLKDNWKRGAVTQKGHQASGQFGRPGPGGTFETWLEPARRGVWQEEGQGSALEKQQ